MKYKYLECKIEDEKLVVKLVDNEHGTLCIYHFSEHGSMVFLGYGNSLDAGDFTYHYP